MVSGIDSVLGSVTKAKGTTQVVLNLVDSYINVRDIAKEPRQ
jgi:hypothetical protein